MIRVASIPKPFLFKSRHTNLNPLISTRFPPLRQQSRETRLYHRPYLSSLCNIRKGSRKLLSSMGFSQHHEDSKLHEFLNYMEKLKNYERIGVPKGAGTDSDDGFDLGRMRRLLQRLGNPQSRFKAVHVAGTKGKGSTTAFLSNILRQEGYLVGCYTSPHLLSIRERISLGPRGDPISVELLRTFFHSVKEILDLSIEMEGGALTHFEVFTALTFALFSQQGVDVAIIEAGLGGARDATNVLCSTGLILSVITSIGKEHLSALGGSLESVALAKAEIIKHRRPVVIGGPLPPHIYLIIRNKASSSNSPAVSACDSGIKSNIIKYFRGEDQIPRQSCQICISIKEDIPLFLDLPEVTLRMLGKHQLQNAVTATCAALCLRNEGWRLSDDSIGGGLENTFLPGRGHYLTKEEADTLGLSGVSILIDGAHTEASAKGLSDIIKMDSSMGPLALVVSMANDKDHIAFAMELLRGRRPDVIILTETSIAGGHSRTTSASTLKDVWLSAASNLRVRALDLGTIDQQKTAGFLKEQMNGPAVMIVAHINASVSDSMKMADELLMPMAGGKPTLIVVAGSLHIVASVLAVLQH